MAMRTELKFVPQWDGPVKAWAIKFLVKNVWRVMPEWDVPDLLCEARFIFWKIEQSYPLVNTPSHFMRLFQRSLSNFMITESKRRSRRKEISGSHLQEGEEQPFEEMLFYDGVDLDTKVRRVVEDAPEPARRVMQQIALGECPPRYQWSNGIRETTNEFLCRIAGVNPAEYDLVDQIQRYLKGAQCTA